MRTILTVGILLATSCFVPALCAGESNTEVLVAGAKQLRSVPWTKNIPDKAHLNLFVALYGEELRSACLDTGSIPSHVQGSGIRSLLDSYERGDDWAVKLLTRTMRQRSYLVDFAGERAVRKMEEFRFRNWFRKKTTESQ